MTRSISTPSRWQERLIALGYFHFEPTKEDRQKDIVAVYFRSIRTASGRRKPLNITLYRDERGTWMVRVDTHIRIGRSIVDRASWLGPFAEAAIYNGVYEIEIAVVDEWEKVPDIAPATGF